MNFKTLFFVAFSCTIMALFSFKKAEELNANPKLSITNMSIVNSGNYCYDISFQLSGSKAYNSDVTYHFAGKNFTAGNMAPGDTYSTTHCLLIEQSLSSNCNILLSCTINDPIMGFMTDGCVIVVDGCRRYSHTSPPPTVPVGGFDVPW